MAALKTLRWRGHGTLRFAAVDYTETVFIHGGPADDNALPRT